MAGIPIFDDGGGGVSWVVIKLLRLIDGVLRRGEVLDSVFLVSCIPGLGPHVFWGVVTGPIYSEACSVGKVDF